MKINEKNYKIREGMRKQGSMKKVNTLAALKKKNFFSIFQGFQSCKASVHVWQKYRNDGGIWANQHLRGLIFIIMPSQAHSDLSG